MKIPAARLASLSVLPIVWMVSMALTPALLAQCPDTSQEYIRANRRVASLLTSINDLKWKELTIYEITGDISAALLQKQNQEDSLDLLRLTAIGESIIDEPVPDFYQRALSTAARFSRCDAFKTNMATQLQVEVDDFDEALIDEACNLAKTIQTRRAGRAKQFYLVTSKEKTNPRLIAMLGVKDNGGGDIAIISQRAGAELFTYLNSNCAPTGLYTDIKNAVAESSPDLVNKMFMLRRLSEINIVDRTVARASYLEEEDFRFILTSISEGRPIRSGDTAAAADPAAGGMFGDAGGVFGGGNTGDEGTERIVKGASVPGAVEYPNEITVGTDVLLAFHNYDLSKKNDPKLVWGVELENNFDEINYPSIWGGRMSLSALLENVKIGAILPTLRFGSDTSIAASGLGTRPQKLMSGYGVLFSGDFTAPLLANSGLFNFYASYTFSESNSGIGPQTFNEASRVFSGGEPAWLIRYAFQGYYSFGFYADANATHLFRLKFGGTVYGVDRYLSRPDTTVSLNDVSERPLALFKDGSETVGGVSGKIEYMKGGQAIPFGAGVQYNDQSILANVWLQFIINPSLDLKLEGKYFTPMFRDPHDWENVNNVVPSLSVKYHF
jgi:hypothetical protein